MDVFWFTLMVAVASFLFAFVWAKVSINWLRWLLAASMPLLVAGAIYWTPVWLGGDASEYSAWAGVAVILGGVPGAVISVFAVFLIRRFRRNAPQLRE